MNVTLDGISLVDPRHELAQLPLLKGAIAASIDPSLLRQTYTQRTGVDPGRGTVLMAGEDFARIVQPSALTHELRFSDSGNSVTISRLAITDARVLIPGTSELVLVTLCDARYYGGMTLLSRAYNRRLATGTLTATDTVRDILRSIFTDSLQPAFGGTLIMPSGPQDIAVEELRFHGVSAWEAFAAICEHVNWGVWIDRDGNLVVDPGGAGPAAPESLAALVQNKLIDAEWPKVPTALPETIHVMFHSHDYQWWRTEEQSRCATDHYRKAPTFRHPVEVAQFIGLDKSRLVAGTSMPLWSTMPVITDDTGAVQNQASATDHAKRLAKAWVLGQVDSDPKHWQFSGVHALELGYLTDITWALDTVGVTTTVSATPGQPRLEDYSPQPPDLARTHLPHWRFGVGRVISRADASPGETTSEAVIPAGAAIVVMLQSGHLTPGQSRVEWQDRATILAYGVTEVAPGNRVELRYEYQIGLGGRWLAFGGGSDGGASDVFSTCTRAVRHIARRSMARGLGVRRDAMLRIVSDNADPEGPPLIDFVAGPDETVLWSGGKRLYWHSEPLTSSVRVRKWVKWSPGASDLGYVVGTTMLGPPLFGSVQMRLPPAPTRSHRYLISGPSIGLSTNLDWIGPGLTGSVALEPCGGSYSGGGGECIILSFNNGLLVGGPPGLFSYPPYVGGSIYADLQGPKWNQCEDGEAPSDQGDVGLGDGTTDGGNDLDILGDDFDPDLDPDDLDGPDLDVF